MLWTILTLMTALAAVGLAIPLVRRHDARRAHSLQRGGGGVVEILKAQLGEIEAQAALGTLEPAEAEALKTDVKRRVLAEGRQPEPAPKPMSERNLVPLALGLAAIVALAATGLYLKLGAPQMGVTPTGPRAAGLPDPQTLPAGHPGGDPSSMITALEAKMKQAPNDPEGWRMLGWSYLQVGRNGEAAVAYGRAVALDPKNGEYLSAQGEATVLAAQGQVTPAAETIFHKAVAIEAADPRARYYLAIAKDQKGDAKGAMDDWIAMLKTAPPDAPWAPEVRTFVEKVAKERGVDLTGRLPPAPAQTASQAPPGRPGPGPNAEQVAAAGQMSDAGRQAMIQGMVEKLAGDLKRDPRNRDGWVRLMRARMVLGQAGPAAQAYRDGAKAFAGSPADQAALREAAAGLGIPGI
jgi:cytochrome c-type biogenesis protein CcmH